jgi:hypothetical protein
MSTARRAEHITQGDKGTPPPSPTLEKFRACTFTKYYFEQIFS